MRVMRTNEGWRPKHHGLPGRYALVVWLGLSAPALAAQELPAPVDIRGVVTEEEALYPDLSALAKRSDLVVIGWVSEQRGDAGAYVPQVLLRHTVRIQEVLLGGAPAVGSLSVVEALEGFPAMAVGTFEVRTVRRSRPLARGAAYALFLQAKPGKDGEYILVGEGLGQYQLDSAQNRVLAGSLSVRHPLVTTNEGRSVQEFLAELHQVVDAWRALAPR